MEANSQAEYVASDLLHMIVMLVFGLCVGKFSNSRGEYVVFLLKDIQRNMCCRGACISVNTITRAEDQCSLRQQGVYIGYIYAILSVYSHVASYTQIICASKIYSHTSLEQYTRWSPTSKHRQRHLTLPAIRSLGDRPLSLNPQSCPKRPDGRSTHIEGFI